MVQAVRIDTLTASALHVSKDLDVKVVSPRVCAVILDFSKDYDVIFVFLLIVQNVACIFAVRSFDLTMN